MIGHLCRQILGEKVGRDRIAEQPAAPRQGQRLDDAFTRVATEPPRETQTLEPHERRVVELLIDRRERERLVQAQAEQDTLFASHRLWQQLDLAPRAPAL